MKRLGAYTGKIYDDNEIGIEECCIQLSETKSEVDINIMRKDRHAKCIQCMTFAYLAHIQLDCMAKNDDMFKPIINMEKSITCFSEDIIK